MDGRLNLLLNRYCREKYDGQDTVERVKIGVFNRVQSVKNFIEIIIIIIIIIIIMY